MWFLLGILIVIFVLNLILLLDAVKNDKAKGENIIFLYLFTVFLSGLSILMNILIIKNQM